MVSGEPVLDPLSAERVKDRFWAGSVRVILALFTLVTLPLFFPDAQAYLPILVAYLAGSVLFQIAIAKNIGGASRQFLGGVMDVALVTFVVHRMGAMSSPMMAAYLLTGMFYSMVAPAWAAITLAALGIMAYAAVCYGAAFGLLAYAPAFPEFAGVKPTVSTATPSVLWLAALVSASTLVSRRIAVRLRQREEELRRRERELKDANSQLEELSQRDPLTLLYNRRHFMRRAEDELERVRRGHPTVLLMLDLDGFKKVNDAAGHLAGDALLREIASAIQESTRAVDVIGRFGGDEFVILLTDTDEDQAILVAERLVTAIRQRGLPELGAPPVTASIGLARARAEQDVNALINAADEAAYRAKREGGDRYAKAPPATLAV